MHQNRASPLASDSCRRRGYRRECRSEDHFTHFLCRRNRGSLAIFFAEEIAHLGASKNRDFLGSGRNRRRSRRESRDFGALSLQVVPGRHPKASRKVSHKADPGICSTCCSEKLRDFYSLNPSLAGMVPPFKGTFTGRTLWRCWLACCD